MCDMFGRLRQLYSEGFFYWQNPLALCLYGLLASFVLAAADHYLAPVPIGLWMLSMAVWVFTSLVTLFCLCILGYGIACRLKH